MGRRGNNEGTIFKRKDGRWQGAISHAGRRTFVYGKTRTETLEKLRKLQSQVEKGINLKAGNYTVESFLEHWLNSKSGVLSNNSTSLYRHMIRTHINPSIGKIKLKDLRSDVIQSLYQQKNSYEDSTLRVIHAILHNALKQAMIWDLIPKNPAASVIKPKVARKEMTYLTQDQAQAIITHLAGTRWEVFYYMAISLGLRRGELLALTWDDVDWVRKTLRVARQAIYSKGEGTQANTPKTRYSSRTLVLGNTAIEKLKEHRKLQKIEVAFHPNWEENNLIFPNTEGKMYNPHTISSQHQQLMKKLGFKNVRFHDLRHTAATLMLQQGVHPRTVQEILGHSSISTTLGTYSHVTPRMREDAAILMDEILTPISVDIKT